MRSILVFLLSCTISCGFAQSDHRKNFDENMWEKYVGVYRNDDNSNFFVSLDWGSALVFTNTSTGFKLVLKKKENDVYHSGDSLTVIFIHDNKNNISGIDLKNKSEILRLAKVPISFEKIVVSSKGAIINGTLIRLKNNKAVPAIIVNGGASWIIRDTNLEEALFYVSQGLAAVVYDKRGWGESTGEKIVPFSQTAEDINAIAEYLKLRTDVLPDKIGISTYSQSGWFGTLATSTSNVIAYQIMNVPAATFIYRQEKQRINNELKADGFSKDEIATALKLFDLMSQYSIKGNNWPDYKALRDANSNKAWIKYMFAPDNNKKETWEWGRMNWQYNPLPALMKITVPTLVLLGEMDLKVSPEVNKSIFEMVFDAAKNKDYEIHIIDKMNHSLKISSEDGARKANDTHRIPPDLFLIKIKWLKERGYIIK